MEHFLFQNGERIGPYTLDELQDWLDARQISSADSVWFDGCSDWVPVRDVPGIRVPGMTGHALDADLVPPFAAYQGDEPYVFVSYSHKDCSVVFEEIQHLSDTGYKIWYDEGIDAGNEWPEEIANAVIGCSLFLAFVSPRATSSDNCRNEINLALNEKKPFLAIHLEETELPPGLRLRMGDLQAILRYRLPQDRYQQKTGIMLDQLLGKTPPKSKKKAPAVQQSAPSNEIEPVALIGQSDAALSVREPAKPRPKGLAVALASVLLVACCIGGYLLYDKGGDVADETPRTDTTAATFPPGKHYLIPSVSMEMIRCEPGTFMMGSPENEEGRERDHQDRDETQHQVTLTKAFHLGKYEVTQAQWAKVMGNNPSNSQGDDLPVEMITWNEIMEFCKQLTWMEQSAGRLPEGYVYTLPTEAQWEYACRAGTTSPYSFGTRLTKEHANIDKSVGKTANVGKYPPNAWGFHDMHGNVSERVLDWFGDYPKGAVVDPTGPRFGSNRPIRGGCFIWDVNLRSAYRRGCDEDLLRDYLGFRLCLKKTQTPKAAEQPTPGKPWIVPTVDLEMLWCKSGTFMMGSPENEKPRNKNETQHKVTLTKGFHLGKYEVTQSQWVEVMGKNPSESKGDDLPVEKVSWEDAMRFCQKLTKLEHEAGRIPEGWKYTLPTEAQWEFACRAGTLSAYAFGDRITSEQANIESTVEKTTVVGSYSANAWGFHDLHGNVWEWTADWSGNYPVWAVKDPEGAGSGVDRVFRGGSCRNNGGSVRSASRREATPDFMASYVGFRLCLQKTQAPKADEQPTPGKPWTVPTGYVEMLWCKPGTFMMGSPKDEEGRNLDWSGNERTLGDYDETLHQVTLTKGFHLGKYEVTQAQWAKVMGNNPSTFKGDNLPMGNVSWNGIMEFCKQLTHLEKTAGRLPGGYVYTLPTEAQWEYACRAGTTSPYTFGVRVTAEQANWNPTGVRQAGKTKFVGTYPANAWGFHEMPGNATEWVRDWYGPYPKDAVKDPTGPTFGSTRIGRGGSCWGYVGNMRSAYREGTHGPDNTLSDWGFRLSLQTE